MKQIPVKLEDFYEFKGGWGLAPYEIYLSIKHVDYQDKLRILEFGSGEGTTHLVNFLLAKEVAFEYSSIENDSNYAKTPNVDYQLYEIKDNYSLSDLDAVKLNLIGYYDLVIVDGPHGIGRSRWYHKFRDLVRIGTVILVDDFHHYSEFGQELDNNFEYETINLFNLNRQFTSEDVNEGTEKVDLNSDFILDKSYKIVKVKNIR